MRSDAENLLSRLGQNKFRYQEFRDNFADMELWPLFEALIRDPRISGDTAVAGLDRDEAHPGAGSAGAGRPYPASAVPQSVAKADARADGLFGRYETTPLAGPAHEDVRSLLRQLSDRVAAGEL